MKFLKRLKSGNFWISMISAVVLILQAVFDIEIKTEYLNQIILAILGILVMSGIVSESPSEEITIKQTDVSSMLDNIGEKICNILSLDVANLTSTNQQSSGNVTEVQASASCVNNNNSADVTSTQTSMGAVQSAETAIRSADNCETATETREADFTKSPSQVETCGTMPVQSGQNLFQSNENAKVIITNFQPTNTADITISETQTNDELNNMQTNEPINLDTNIQPKYYQNNMADINQTPQIEVVAQNETPLHQEITDTL